MGLFYRSVEDIKGPDFKGNISQNIDPFAGEEYRGMATLSDGTKIELTAGSAREARSELMAAARDNKK